MLLSALEKLEGGAAPQNVDDLDEAMLALMEAEKEIADEADAVEEMDEVVEEAEEAIERLEGIRDAIAEFGISKPMMLAADPKRELVDGGIIGDYEDLDTVPVKDEAASAAVENLGKTVRKVWDKLVEFFKGLGAKLKSFFDTIMRGFKSYEQAIVATLKKLKDVKVDAKKLKETEVSAVSTDDFGKIKDAAADLVGVAGMSSKINSINKELMEVFVGKNTSLSKDDIDSKVKTIITDMKTVVTKSVTSATGLEVKEDRIEKGKADIERKKGDLAKYNWDKSKAEGALKDSLAALKDAAKTEKSIKDSLKTLDEMTKELSKQTKVVEDLENKEIDRRSAAVQGVRKVVNAARTISQHGLTETQKMASIALAVGKGVIKSKEDKD